MGSTSRKRSAAVINVLGALTAALCKVADGVAVHGKAYSAELQQLFQAMVQRGLHRSSCSWVLPSSA